MIILKIIGISLAGAVLSLLIKRQRPELAIAIPMLTAAVVLTICVPYLTEVIDGFSELADASGVTLPHMQIVLRIIGIAYICQFASDICRDAGEISIAAKIELGGKIIIIAVSMPVINDLLALVNDIIQT